MRTSSPRPGPRRASARTTRRAIAAFFVLLALLAISPARAGWWDDAAEARETSLAELRRAPRKWRDVPVLLRVRFGGVGERIQPYFTQFTPERWQPVRLLPPADAKGAERELRTAFVLRGGREDLRLARISPNLAVMARAVVRDAVDGEPWIEVLSFTLAGDPLTPEEQTRVREADRFLDRRNPVAAENIYRRILRGRDLAKRDQAALLRKIGVALHDQRRPADALTAFREAIALDPDDLDARHRATHLEQSLARVPLAPESADGPPTSARAAPTTPTAPEPIDTPLLLPGRGPQLAPPSGLPAKPTPSAEDDVAPESAEPQPAPTQPRTHATPPKPRTARPAPGSDASGASEESVDPDPEDAPEPSDDEATPPVPKPPRLSGPK